MAAADMTVLDTTKGDRALNSTALAAMVVAAPTPFVAALAAAQQAQAVVIDTAQTLAAAGATQGNAGAITNSLVFVTVTASTQGVRLPAGATPGQKHEIWADPAVGVKVYPHSNGQIEAVATNTAVALVKAKSSIFRAVSATKWRMLAGA